LRPEWFGPWPHQRALRPRAANKQQPTLTQHDHGRPFGCATRLLLCSHPGFPQEENAWIIIVGVAMQEVFRFAYWKLLKCVAAQYTTAARARSASLSLCPFPPLSLCVSLSVSPCGCLCVTVFVRECGGRVYVPASFPPRCRGSWSNPRGFLCTRSPALLVCNTGRQKRALPPSGTTAAEVPRGQSKQ